MKLTRKLIVAFSLLILVLVGFSIDNADANISVGKHTCYDITVYSGGTTVAYDCSDCKPYRNVKEYKAGSKSICPK